MQVAGYTHEQVFAVVEDVINKVAPRHVFGSHTVEDVKQMGWVLALELLNKNVFEPERGSLAGFVSRHVSNRLKNVRRNELWRVQSPCERCRKAAAGIGTYCAGQEPCKAYRLYLERNLAKANIAMGLPIDGIDDESEPSTRTEPQVESDAEIKEVIHLLDAELSVEHRELMLRMRCGEKLPKAKRVVLMEAVADVLDDHGLPLPAYLNPAA